MDFLPLIDVPADIKKLNKADLPQLAQEIRTFLIETVSQVGGHFASNLGCVELTLALHYVYDTPVDNIVWDVGHQTYPHKMITGRKHQLHTIRQLGGLSGFPLRSESIYDAFGVGHSSTSIGAALGMAIAAAHQGIHKHNIAVIGDAALSAGQAFEAMSHAGSLELDFLTILNDNDMSISPNVGGLNQYLTRLLSSDSYAKLRKTSQTILSHVRPIHDFAGRIEEHAKGMVLPSSTMFEEFGFNYIGPIDGHDVIALVDVLTAIKAFKGPQFLHVATKKGYGYDKAVADPVTYHAVPPFDVAAGVQASAAKVTYSSVFGDWLCDTARRDSRLMAITPAMREGSGMVRFHQEHPAQYIDVAIAEQHAVTLAAGLACEGLKPVVAIYSSFLQRGYDQLIHDVALQNLPVMFAIDRAGLVGSDGATHAGSFDLAFLRCIPNLTIMAPSDELECRLLLNTAYAMNTPAAVRYPRGANTAVAPQATDETLTIGEGIIRVQGQKVAFVAFGSMVKPACVAAQQLNATVADMRFVKPLDRALLKTLAATHEILITLEDHVVQGGAGSACIEALIAMDVALPRIYQWGLPDAFIEHGLQSELFELVGLDAASLIQRTELLLR